MADPALLRFDFKLTSDEKMQPVIQKYRRGRPFLNIVTRWSRSTSNLYALIGPNLTGELMQKIYAASWNLFTLTAEADIVLCQLVMFLTVFLHWMYKMKCSCYQESSVFHGYSLFVGFLVEKCVVCHSRKSDFGWQRFRFSPGLIRCVRGFKSHKRFWPYLITSWSCISNGKPE